MNPEEQRSRIAVLLFTDMVDSVGMERRLGTEAYSRLLKAHHQLFLQALAQIGSGKIHLDTGDGFLSEFNTAADAVNVALLFQLYLRERKWDTETPKVRIGLHQGQLAEIRLDPELPGKIVGIPVSIAHRVMSLAQPGQILMTRAVYDDARQFVREHPLSTVPGRSRLSLKWKGHGTYLFKGNEEPTEVFEVGASGIAPLTPPPNTEKARRADSAPETPRRPPTPRPVLVAVLTALCGAVLWVLPFGDIWVTGSYDTLFRFGSRMPTNKVVLVLLDNYSISALGQSRGDWDRSLHAALLNKLADGGNSLVVFDILFKTPKNTETDAALAAAIRRHGHVVLMAKPSEPYFRQLKMASVTLPNTNFLEAAAAYGIGAVNARNEHEVVRRHWPFPAPGEERFESLPWAAAQLAGGKLSEQPQKQWLRYYGGNGAWETFSYHLALSNSPAYFRDKIVFVGSDPPSAEPGAPWEDKFLTPYSARTGEAVGGVTILATTFLNLMNGDWLRRLPWPVELLMLLLSGASIGFGVSRVSPVKALWFSIAVALVAVVAGVFLSYFSNYWFPWLVIAGGQIPCALISALILNRAPARVRAPALVAAPASKTPVLPADEPGPPAIAEYDLFEPAIGEGAFGKVWLGRSAIGQWQAIKVVRRSSFHNDFQYNTEFEGIKKYKPVSERHAALLRIELVSAKKPDGYFYYVMELGDPQQPGWQENPALYKPRTLASLRAQAASGRLPIPFCVEIGLTLAEALDFLHTHNLTHRDIKPANVIFVHERAKLADVGLVTDARLLDSKATRVGTPGYMPPPPEAPGTRQADIYALGMVLYVISTGREPESFPELSTTLVERTGHEEFMSLDAIILKACQIDPKARYASVSEMRQALQKAKHEIIPHPTP